MATLNGAKRDLCRRPSYQTAPSPSRSHAVILDVTAQRDGGLPCEGWGSEGAPSPPDRVTRHHTQIPNPVMGTVCRSLWGGRAGNLRTLFGLRSGWTRPVAGGRVGLALPTSVGLGPDRSLSAVELMVLGSATPTRPWRDFDARGSKNQDFSTPCAAKSRGGGGAPPTTLILLRNQRASRRPSTARRRRRTNGRAHPGPAVAAALGFWALIAQ